MPHFSPPAPHFYSGKVFTVFGAGLSGFAVARFLSEHGAEVRVTESRTREAFERSSPLSGEIRALETQGVTFEFGGHSAEQVLRSDAVVVSPGVPLTIDALALARARGIALTSEVDLAAAFIAQARVPVVGVTGSAGKTTVTTLIGQMIAQSGRTVFVGGNIGTPVIEYVRGGCSEGIVVLELSSFQLELIRNLDLDVAVVTTFAEDHLDRYPSVDAYADAKLRMLAACGPRSTVVLQAQNIRKARFIDAARARGVTDLNEIPGEMNHLQANFASAAAAVRALGVEDASIDQVIASFRGLPHRIEEVGAHLWVRFVNDSKATNAAAVRACLQSFSSKVGAQGHSVHFHSVHLMMGGQSKELDFAPIVEELRRVVASVSCFGASGATVAAALNRLLDADGQRSGLRRPDIAVFSTLEAAAENATRRAFQEAASVSGSFENLEKPEIIVLLSPGCTSLDAYRNYAERGDAFRRWVTERLQRL